MSDALAADVPRAAIGCGAPAPGGELAVVAMGAVVPEAIAAVARIGERTSRVGLLVVTSPDRLHARMARARAALAHRAAAGAAGARCGAGHACSTAIR